MGGIIRDLVRVDINPPNAGSFVSRQLPPSSNFFIEPFVHSRTDLTMAQQRLALWNAEEDLEDEVDLSIAIGNYGPNVQYEDGGCMNH